MRQDVRAPHSNPNLWKAFLDLLERPTPDPIALEPLLPDLERADLLEDALAECRRRHRDRSAQRLWKPFRDRLEALGNQARTRRAAQWQFDPKRRTLHLKLTLNRPFTDLNPSQRVHTLTEALKSGGLAIALGLEKHPRPLLSFAHPLPIGLEGKGEWAEAILKVPAPFPLDEFPKRLSDHLPEGVTILEARGVPNHATPLTERCVSAHWTWTVPDVLRPLAQERFRDFLAATHWTVSKTGKQDGHKTLKQVDVRDRILDLSWDDEVLHVQLRHERGEAMNPVKLFAGILEIDPARITNLVRQSLTLEADPRLEAGDRYAPKLHNIWEDAVLLESSDEPFEPHDVDDDDEPLRLG